MAKQYVLKKIYAIKKLYIWLYSMYLKKYTDFFLVKLILKYIDSCDIFCGFFFKDKINLKIHTSLEMFCE